MSGDQYFQFLNKEFKKAKKANIRKSFFRNETLSERSSSYNPTITSQHQDSNNLRLLPDTASTSARVRLS